MLPWAIEEANRNGGAAENHWWAANPREAMFFKTLSLFGGLSSLGLALVTLVASSLLTWLGLDWIEIPVYLQNLFSGFAKLIGDEPVPPYYDP